MEQVHEVKTTMEKLRMMAEQQQKESEGTPVRETVQIMAQGSANFIITPDTLFI
jgi:hypothetical protein